MRRFGLCLATLGALWSLQPASAAGPAGAPRRDAVARTSISSGEANAPRRGRFLVATRQVIAPLFARAVVLLLDCGPEGALGLIVNRPLGASVGELLPEVAELKGHSEPAYVGGPVEPTQVMMLIQASQAPPDSLALFGDVYVSRSLESLHQRSGKRFRAYVGYAGWTVGQLEAEIARGDWYVDSAEAAAIFDMPAGEVWPKYVDRNSGVQTRAPARGLQAWTRLRNTRSSHASSATWSARPIAIAGQKPSPPVLAVQNARIGQ